MESSGFYTEHAVIVLVELYVIACCVVGMVRLWFAHRRGHFERYFPYVFGFVVATLLGLTAIVVCLQLWIFHFLPWTAMETPWYYWIKGLSGNRQTILPPLLIGQGLLLLFLGVSVLRALADALGTCWELAALDLLHRWHRAHWRWAAGRWWWLKVAGGVAVAFGLVAAVLLGVPTLMRRGTQTFLPPWWQRICVGLHPSVTVRRVALRDLAYEGDYKDDPVVFFTALRDTTTLADNMPSRVKEDIYRPYGPERSESFDRWCRIMAQHLDDHRELYDTADLTRPGNRRVLTHVLGHMPADGGWARGRLVDRLGDGDEEIRLVALDYLVVRFGYTGYREILGPMLADRQQLYITERWIFDHLDAGVEVLIRDCELYRLVTVPRDARSWNRYQALVRWRQAMVDRGLPLPEFADPSLAAPGRTGRLSP